MCVVRYSDGENRERGGGRKGDREGIQLTHPSKCPDLSEQKLAALPQSLS